MSLITLFVKQHATFFHGSVASIALVVTVTLTGCNRVTQADTAVGSARARGGRETEKPSNRLPKSSLTREYWVTNEGVDGGRNDGSRGKPWRTIGFADSQLKLGTGGAIVHVIGQQTYPSLTTKAGGRPATPVIFQGESGAALIFSEGGWTVMGDYVTIRGFDITGSQIATAIGLFGDGDSAVGNYIHDLAGTGGYRPNCPPTGAIIQSPGLGRDHVRAVTYLGGEISGNRINNIGARDNGCVEWHGIYAKFPHTAIRNNIISNVGKGWGIQLYGYSCYDKIVNNTLFGNTQGGLLLSHGTWTNDAAAAAQCPADHPEDYITVTNNILIDSTNPAGRGNERGHGLTFYKGGCLLDSPFGKHILIANNLLYGNANGDFYDNCRTGYSPQNGFSDQRGDITFVDYRRDGTGDYHLKAGSQAVAHGMASCATGSEKCAPDTDYEGLVRDQSRTPDIGAYAFQPSKRTGR